MTHELFSWGSGAYGRLGMGNLEDVPHPARIGGVCNGYDFHSLSCSWYHSAASTTSGQVMTFGTNTNACIGADEGKWSDSDDSSSGGGEGNDSQSDDDDADNDDDDFANKIF